MQIVSSILLDEATPAPSHGPVLVLGGEAALPNALADEGVPVHWRPVLVTEQREAMPDVVARNADNAGSYGRVFLPIPPDRDLARRWILTAYDLVAPGGDLLIAGANTDGAKPVIADAAAVFSAPVSSGYRQKHRYARYVRREAEAELPAWTTKPGIAPETWQHFTVTFRGEDIELETRPGVFAGDRLDIGTALLLDHLEVPAGARVLDVGCGAGIIGVAASRSGAAHVDLVDADLLAVQAATRNLQRLRIPGRVLASDVYDAVPGERYDLIVSNPPFHRGREVDTSVADRLINEAPRHLAQGGRLLIVANAFLAYGKVMERVFGHVETVAATRQYHILTASDPR